MPGKRKNTKEVSSSEEESSSEESSEDPEPAKKKVARKPAAKKAAPKKASKKPAAKKAAAKRGKKQPETSSEEESSSEEASSSSSSEEAEPPKKKAAKKGAKKPAAKKAAPKKAQPKKKEPTPESESSGSSEAESSESEDEPKSPSSPTDGSRQVDREAARLGTFSVVGDYSVKLNQTNVHDGKNNNKYYIIQVLKGAGDTYYTYTRWGRVGEPGTNANAKAVSEEAAIKGFVKKFKEKTANPYPFTKFVKKDGKYGFVEADDDGGDDTPLGKLSEAQIKKGQDVLDELTACVSKKKTKDIARLSSSYYTLIPTITGRTAPPPLSTEEAIQEKKALLEFYLRMGFSGVEKDKSVNPISGVMDLPVAASLADAVKSIGKVTDLFAGKSKHLASKQAGSPVRTMHEKLYAALLLYTSNAIYGDLNKSLRDQIASACKKYLPYLRMFFEATEHLPRKNRTLWRGIGVDLHAQYTVGSEVTWWSVSSCTASKGVAESFMKGCGSGSTFCTINTKTACDISSITMYPHEKECILRPGTTLKVVSNTKKSGITYIELQETGTALLR